MVQADRLDKDLAALDIDGASRSAAVARARTLLAGGAWVGSYVLATAILEETYTAMHSR